MMQPDLIERLKLIIGNPWVFDRLAQCDVEAINDAIAALSLTLPDDVANYDCCDEHETVYLIGGDCPECVPPSMPDGE